MLLYIHHWHPPSDEKVLVHNYVCDIYDNLEAHEYIDITKRTLGKLRATLAPSTASPRGCSGPDCPMMIADRQRDVRYDVKVNERGSVVKSPAWRVRLKTIVYSC